MRRLRARSGIFVQDRESGTTESVSVDSGGAERNDVSDYTWISPGGRFVAFESNATNLVGGDTNGVQDIFVHDRQSGTTERVSVDSGGIQANGDSVSSSISASGRYAAFMSGATNLVGGDTNWKFDIFVRARATEIGTKYCIANANSTGSPADLWASGSASSGAGLLAVVRSLLITPVCAATRAAHLNQHSRYGYLRYHPNSMERHPRRMR